MSFLESRFSPCFIAIGLFLLAGCSRSTVSTSFSAPGFSLADLRTSPSQLVVAPEVEVKAFKKTYSALFRDSTVLSARISRKIRDSLDLPLTDSTIPSSKYVIFVRSVTIEDSLLPIPEIPLPGPGSGTMQPTHGSTGIAVIVTFNVEILDKALEKQYAFTVRSQSDVPLYAYKTAVLNGIDGSARKAARHLMGK